MGKWPSLAKGYITYFSSFYNDRGSAPLSLSRAVPCRLLYISTDSRLVTTPFISSITLVLFLKAPISTSSLAVLAYLSIVGTNLVVPDPC